MCHFSLQCLPVITFVMKFTFTLVMFFSESTNSTCCVLQHLTGRAKQKQKTLNGWFESWLKYRLSNYNVLHIFFGIEFKGVGNKHYSSAKASL